MKYTKRKTRDNITYRFYTGKGDQHLTFTKVGNLIEGDTYTRAWTWKNRKAYEDILHQILSDI